VDQLPEGLRESLYVKDDDWKMSLLFSNYVTFTNTSDAELDEIIRKHYSPLYVSVHTADAELRARMMNCPPRSADIMRVIDKLHAGGIVLHAQTVLCPGLNDGRYLNETIEALRGKARSLAVVPVGITKYQKNPVVKAVTRETAQKLIKTVNEYQKKYLYETGSRFVWCSDEMYQRAGLPIPDFDFYESLPQIANGVGLLAQFEREFEFAFNNDRLPITGRRPPAAPASSTPIRKRQYTVSVATGESAYEFMSDICRRAETALGNIKINCYKIVNNFFGESVTVAGLIAGGDIAKTLKGEGLGEVLLLPSVMLRSEGDLFLDGMSLAGLSAALGGVKVEVVGTDGGEFYDKVKSKR